MFLAYSDSFLKQAQISKELIEAKALAVEEVNLNRYLVLVLILATILVLILNYNPNPNLDTSQRLRKFRVTPKYYF